jgi:serine phosphatase RsbU (regulator of sigma subunit)
MTDEKKKGITHHAGRRTLLVWVIALGSIFVNRQIGHFLRMFHRSSSILSFFSFLAWLLVIAIALYWVAMAIRYLLRKLFWRVGRRLFLSYILIGVLPFLLMTVLMFVVAYMVAGVMSQAALRGERQATLGQMESWSLEYSLTGKRPGNGLPTVEIHDSENGSGSDLPEWLKRTTFSGMVWRNTQPLLVSSHQYEERGRSVVFVQPLDQNWAENLEERGGMIISYEQPSPDKEKEKEAKKKRNARIRVSGRERGDINIEGDGFDDFVKRAWGWDRIIWGDVSDLTDWKTGKVTGDHELLTLISNPIRNLFQFYFGSPDGGYLRYLVQIIIALTIMLLLIYVMASAFAAVLIFSISRAVNRIEKGTKAVERGDFSYRINMKPRFQLGAMALSFDRMTESIGSLLVKVAEKERLQSEIDIAASIQRNLLPREGPRFRGVTFSAHFEPTASIGGDYYDVFNLDKSRLAVAIGDVSGHGLSTGLVMAMVKAAITTLVEQGADEASLFTRLNDLVHRSTERRAFMTLAFTIFDLEKATIRHTNAGHLYPYVLRRGVAPFAIEGPSLPLGVRSAIHARTIDLELCEGDALVYLSDGIVEAQDDRGEPFGFEKLEVLLSGLQERTPAAIQEAILTAVAEHAAGRPADDDRTVMVLRFEELPVRHADVPASDLTTAVA